MKEVITQWVVQVAGDTEKEDGQENLRGADRKKNSDVSILPFTLRVVGVRESVRR